MNNKEIVKLFYEYVVSENRLDEAVRFLSAEYVEEMCQHLKSVRNTYPDYTISITRQFEDGILGDVFVITAAVDFDLGHRADPREMSDKESTTWFHDESYDDIAVVRLDQTLSDHVFGLVENVRLETTENTVRFLGREYPGEKWADRQPQVMRGTSVTSDTYWKGKFDHQNALLITETYDCTDPFAITEMEDIAVGQAVKNFGLLDRLIILRTAVNMDVLPTGVTPEMLWGTESDDHVASQDSMESVDIFKTAMQNCFSAGKVLIDAILEGAF